MNNLKYAFIALTLDWKMLLELLEQCEGVKSF